MLLYNIMRDETEEVSLACWLRTQLVHCYGRSKVQFFGLINWISFKQFGKFVACNFNWRNFRRKWRV